MALTEAEVGLCNQSLGKIGGLDFTFGDVTSLQSKKCLLFFDQTRNALLRQYEWSFAQVRLRLVSAWKTAEVYTTDQYVWEDSSLYKCSIAHTAGTFATDLASVYWTLDSGSTTFGYTYSLPSTSLRLVQNDNGYSTNWNWYGTYEYPLSNRASNTWRFESSKILTKETAIDVVYIDTITDTTKWDPLFTELFIAVQARKLYGPLGGAGRGSKTLRDDLNFEIRTLKSLARTVDGQEGNNSGSSDWNNARYS